jgi:hypothetical protein
VTKQFISGAVGLGLVLFSALDAVPQQDAKTTDAKAPVVFTTQQDYENMLAQLGITKLRPGRSSNAGSPNAANYDDSAANPYPELPEILECVNGDSADTAEA